MKNRRVTVLLVLGLFGASGCAHVRPAVPGALPEVRPRPDQRESSEPALPTSDWWTTLDDPVLERLVARALDDNLDVRVAAARRREARATWNREGADRVPRLDGSGGVDGTRRTAETPDGTGEQVERRETWIARVEASYEVDLFGAVALRSDAAAARVVSSDAALASLRVAVSADVVRRYFDARHLADESAVLEQAIALRRDSLRLHAARERAGFGRRSDVARARAELASVEAQRTDVELRRALAWNALAVLCGTTSAELRAELDSVEHTETRSLLGDAPPALPAGVPVDVLLRRPDVAEAHALAIAAGAEVGVARAARLPRLVLTGATGFESIGLSDFLSWGQRTWSIGPSISLPLLDGGRSAADLEEASARFQQADAAFRHTAIQALRDVEDGLVSTRELRDEAAFRAVELEAARTTFDELDRQLRAGHAEPLDHLDAQRSVLDARRAAIRVLGERWQTWVGLVQALGGGWSRPGARGPTVSQDSD